jgi:hypothetical protein
MIQKSSLPENLRSVSMVLTPDTFDIQIFPSFLASASNRNGEIGFMGCVAPANLGGDEEDRS